MNKKNCICEISYWIENMYATYHARDIKQQKKSSINIIIILYIIYFMYICFLLQFHYIRWIKKNPHKKTKIFSSLWERRRKNKNYNFLILIYIFSFFFQTKISDILYRALIFVGRVYVCSCSINYKNKNAFTHCVIYLVIYYWLWMPTVYKSYRIYKCKNHNTNKPSILPEDKTLWNMKTTSQRHRTTIWAMNSVIINHHMRKQSTPTHRAQVTWTQNT